MFLEKPVCGGEHVSPRVVVSPHSHTPNTLSHIHTHTHTHSQTVSLSFRISEKTTLKPCPSITHWSGLERGVSLCVCVHVCMLASVYMCVCLLLCVCARVRLFEVCIFMLASLCVCVHMLLIEQESASNTQTGETLQ